MRSQCRSPVADEEEQNQTTDFPDSSPSSSDPFPNPSKSSVNFDVIMLDKGQMKRTPPRIPRFVLLCRAWFIFCDSHPDPFVLHPIHKHIGISEYLPGGSAGTAPSSTISHLVKTTRSSSARSKALRAARNS